MATWEWLRFFEDAGIPPGPALGYAVAFVDNRIHKDMVLELSRELMKELGVTAVGDAIAILRHAKLLHRQEMCRAASESLPPEAPNHRDRDQNHRDQNHRDQNHRDHRDQVRDRDLNRGQDHRDRGLDQDRVRDRDWDHRNQDLDRDQGLDQAQDHRDRVQDRVQDRIRAQDHQDQAQDHQDRFRDRIWGQDHPLSPSRGAPRGVLGRIIAQSLSRALPPPRSPPGPPRICVTVPNGAGPGGSSWELLGLQRRQVRAQRAPRRLLRPKTGLGRTSVFERLGGEAKESLESSGKPSGIFSRLGEIPASPDPCRDPCRDPRGDPRGDPVDPEALPYAGVLKRQRREIPLEPQDGSVSSSGCWDPPRDPPLRDPPLRDPPRDPPPEGKVSSSSSSSSSSVFRRLGRKMN